MFETLACEGYYFKKLVRGGFANRPPAQERAAESELPPQDILSHFQRAKERVDPELEIDSLPPEILYETTSDDDEADSSRLFLIHEQNNNAVMCSTSDENEVDPWCKQQILIDTSEDEISFKKGSSLNPQLCETSDEEIVPDGPHVQSEMLSSEEEKPKNHQVHDPVSASSETEVEDDEDLIPQEEEESEAEGVLVESEGSVASAPRSTSGHTRPDLEDEQCNMIEQVIELPCPHGSPIVKAVVAFGRTRSEVPMCVDTGSERTCMTSAAMYLYFGDKWRALLQPLKRPLRLKSASGHRLSILGAIRAELTLGEFQCNFPLLVFQNTNIECLIGNDLLIDTIRIDAGRQLSFPGTPCRPIQIHYRTPVTKAYAGKSAFIGPETHGLVPLRIPMTPALVGREVVISMIKDRTDKTPTYHVHNSLASVGADGTCFAIITNPTTELVLIPEKELIANIQIISDSTLAEEVNLVNTKTFAKSNESSEQLLKRLIKQDETWPWQHLSKMPVPACIELTDEAKEHIGKIQLIHDRGDRRDILEGDPKGEPPCPQGHNVPKQGDKDEQGKDWTAELKLDHLSPSRRQALKAIISKYPECFSKHDTELGTFRYFEACLPEAPGATLAVERMRAMSQPMQEEAAKAINQMLAIGCVRPSSSHYASNLVMVKKKTADGSHQYRVCFDGRNLNKTLLNNRFPNVGLEEALSRMSQAYFRTCVDLKWAFWQISLRPEDRHKTAFYAPGPCLLEHSRLPFGLSNSLSIFLMALSLVTAGCNQFLVYFADDLAVITNKENGETEDEAFRRHLVHVQILLRRLSHAGLKLSPSKCHWAFGPRDPLDWLGYSLTQLYTKPMQALVDKVAKFPVPTSVTTAKAFISLASYYRKYINAFCVYSRPICATTKLELGEKFQWTTEAQTAFEILKKQLCARPTLRQPRPWLGEFVIESDASGVGVAAVLMQKDPDDNNREHPCAYASRQLTDCEIKNLGSSAKELLSIIYALTLWSCYTAGCDVTVRTDCKCWTFLRQAAAQSGRVARMGMLLSEHQITVQYIPAEKNRAADGLSRAHEALTKCEDPEIVGKNAEHLDVKAIIKPGESMSLQKFMNNCDQYQRTHPPPTVPFSQVNLLAEVGEAFFQKEGFQAQCEETESSPQSPKLSSEVVKQLFSAEARMEDWDSESWADHPDTPSIREFLATGENQQPLDEANQIMPSDCAGHQPQDAAYHKNVRALEITLETQQQTTSPTDKNLLGIVRHDQSPAGRMALVCMNESPFSLAAFREQQQQCEYTNKLRKELLQQPSNAHVGGFYLRNGIVMKEFQDHNGETHATVVVPEPLRAVLIDEHHRFLLGGHLPPKRIEKRMRRLYFWPGLAAQCNAYARKCVPCQYARKFPVAYVHGRITLPKYPRHIVDIDLMSGFERSYEGHVAILVILDRFSKHAAAIPLKNMRAETVASCFALYYAQIAGWPTALHSDNGSNVDNDIVNWMCRMFGVRKSRTPFYNPRSDPAESLCGALGDLIKIHMSPSDHKNWAVIIPFLISGLNASPTTSTGYTPNEIFWGSDLNTFPPPLIPADEPYVNADSFLNVLRRGQEYKWEVIRNRAQKLQDERLEVTNKHKSKGKFEVGDFVMIKDRSPKGKFEKKLSNRFKGPYRILKVYTSSLVVLPWIHNDEYLARQQGIGNFRRLLEANPVHRFTTEIISKDACKPYVGAMPSPPNYDQFLVGRFLKKLGVKYDEPAEPSVLDPVERPYNLRKRKRDQKPFNPESSSGGSGPEPRYSESTQHPMLNWNAGASDVSANSGGSQGDADSEPEGDHEPAAGDYPGPDPENDGSGPTVRSSESENAEAPESMHDEDQPAQELGDAFPQEAVVPAEAHGVQIPLLDAAARQADVERWVQDPHAAVHSPPGGFLRTRARTARRLGEKEFDSPVLDFAADVAYGQQFHKPISRTSSPARQASPKSKEEEEVEEEEVELERKREEEEDARGALWAPLMPIPMETPVRPQSPPDPPTRSSVQGVRGKNYFRAEGVEIPPQPFHEIVPTIAGRSDIYPSKPVVVKTERTALRAGTRAFSRQQPQTGLTVSHPAERASIQHASRHSTSKVTSPTPPASVSFFQSIDPRDIETGNTVTDFYTKTRSSPAPDRDYSKRSTTTARTPTK